MPPVSTPPEASSTEPSSAGSGGASTSPTFQKLPTPPGDGVEPIVAASFFVTGGTVPFDSASYVTRQADRDLLDSLLAGQFCYVLNARQMGKSSLSVRTMAQLSARGVRTVFLDLTKIGGQNVTPEQWYVGLLAETGRVLGLRAEMVAYWRQNTERSLAERYFGALREVVLERIPATGTTTCDIVLFIDEIDATRSLPFSVDEFFAAIRAFYNDRVHDLVYARLSFCLVGSALPSELIRDTRISPFNIGRRIELRDFTFEEALPLMQGLPRGNRKALLRRIFGWTNGNPFLTQSLCAEVAARPEQFHRARDVDRLVDALFFEVRARSRNVNLSDVSNRILRITDAGDVYDRAAILTFYRKLLNRRKYVPDDEAEPLVGLLKLSGITRSEGGRLFVRCRIYERVFDAHWVEENMPDAELRRQRAAFRRGVVRTAALASAVFAAITSLAVVALLNARAARQVAEASRRELYISEIDQANNALDSGELRHARELLDELRPMPGQTDLREFTWRMLDRRARDQSEKVFADVGDPLYRPALSPDGRDIAVTDSQNTMHVWDRLTGALLSRFSLGQGVVESTEFSPDGEYLVTVSNKNPVHPSLWNWRSGTEVKNDLSLLVNGSTCLPQYFDQGRYMVWTEDINPNTHAPGTGRNEDLGRVDVVRTSDFAIVKRIDAPGPAAVLAVAPDGRSFFVGRVNGRLQQYSTVPPYAEIGAALDVSAHVDQWGHTLEMMALAPDENTMAVSSVNADIYLWDLRTRRKVGILPGAKNVLNGMRFAPNGKTLIDVGYDGKVHVWDVGRRTEAAVLSGHQAGACDLVVTPDSKTLFTSSWDGTLRQWNLAAAVKSGGVPPGREASIAPPRVDLCDEKSILVRSDDQTLTAARRPGEPNAVLVSDVVSGQTAVLRDPGAVVAPSSQTPSQFTPDGRYLWAVSQTLPSRGAKDPGLVLKRWDWRRGTADHAIVLPTLLNVLAVPVNHVAAALQIDATHNIAICIDAQNKLRWLDAFTGRDVVPPIPVAGNVLNYSSKDSEHQDMTPPDAHYGFGYEHRRAGMPNGFDLWWLLPDRRTLLRYVINEATNEADEEIIDSVTGVRSHVVHAAVGPAPGGVITPDGRVHVIHTGSERGTRRFDLTAKPPRELPRFAPHVTNAWLARGVTTTLPNGDARAFVLTMSPDGDVHVNDPYTGTLTASLRGHLQPVNDADLSPDGRTAATASVDQTVALWDVPTQRRLASIPLPFAPVKVRFSRRADLLIVTDEHQNRLILRGSDKVR